METMEVSNVISEEGKQLNSFKSELESMMNILDKSENSKEEYLKIISRVDDILGQIQILEDRMKLEKMKKRVQGIIHNEIPDDKTGISKNLSKLGETMLSILNSMN